LTSNQNDPEKCRNRFVSGECCWKEHRGGAGFAMTGACRQPWDLSLEKMWPPARGMRNRAAGTAYLGVFRPDCPPEKTGRHVSCN